MINRKSEISADRLFMIFIFLLAITIRISLYLKSDGLWSDELAVLWSAENKYSIVEIISANLSAPFQYLVSVWLSIFGNSEHVVRTLPLLISIFTLVFCLYARYAYLLIYLALSPLSHNLAINLKQGVLGELLIVLLIYLFNKCRKSENLTHLLIYHFICGMLIMTNYLNIFIVLASLYAQTRELNNVQIKKVNFIVFVLIMLASYVVYYNYIDTSHLKWLETQGGFLAQVENYLSSASYHLMTQLMLIIFVFLLFNQNKSSTWSRVYLYSIIGFLMISFMLSKEFYYHERFISCYLIVGVCALGEIKKSNLRYFAFLLIFLICLLNYLKPAHLQKNSWKLAANELCKNKNETLTVWSPPGVTYYFGSDCANQSFLGSDLERICGKVLVSRSFADPLSKRLSHYGKTTKTLKSYGQNTIEPLALLEVKCL